MATETEWKTPAAGTRPSPGMSSSTTNDAQNGSRSSFTAGDDSDGTRKATEQAAGRFTSGDTQTNRGGATAYDQAKEAVRDMADRAKEQGRSMLDERKDDAADTVHSTANAFRNTAEQLQGEGQSQTGQYIAMFADKLESFGSQLRTKNVDGLIREAENFGRRSPGTFLAGSLVAGFVLARFLKSSSDRQRDDMRFRHDADGMVDRSYDDLRSRTSREENDAAWAQRGDGAGLLRQRPNVDDRGESIRTTGTPGAGSGMAADADPDLTGAVMEGSDTGGGMSVTSSGSTTPTVKGAPLSGLSTSTPGGPTYVNR